MGLIVRLVSTMYTGCMTLKETLAYVAGFVDGEGYLGIKRYNRYPDNPKYSPTYSERISVAGINEVAIRDFNKIVKGYMYFHKPSKLSNRGYWSWEVTENNARIFLEKIYPYLKVKKPEADVLLQLSAHKVETKSSRLTSKDREYRESLWLKVKEIHTYV